MLLLIGCSLLFSAAAQHTSSKDYRNFPIVLTLQFNNLALPFKNLKSNFSNMGVGIGTEVSHNGGHNWAQQFTALWYRNKTVGNGLLFYTQTSWRPTLFSNIYTEVKAGVGYMIAFRPVEAYKQVNGAWVSVGNKGKGLLALPVGISLGYNNYSDDVYVSPCILPVRTHQRLQQKHSPCAGNLYPGWRTHSSTIQLTLSTFKRSDNEKQLSFLHGYNAVAKQLFAVPAGFANLELHTPGKQRHGLYQSGRRTTGYGRTCAVGCARCRYCHLR